MVMKAKVDPQKKLQNALRDAARKVDDLTLPLTLIAQQWFKSNRAIFTLKSQGKYADLSPLYKRAKQKKVGFIYPVLKLHGWLESSITDPTDPDSINQIINRKSLVLGSNVRNEKNFPYALANQEGWGNLPARPVVLFGNEQVAPKALENRVKTWEREILSYVSQVSGAT